MMGELATEYQEIKVSDVVWREDLYPRLKADPALVQRYAENLDVLPPIEVNQDNILIDGWHRWTAHRKNETDCIKVTVTQTRSDFEIRSLAIKRNAGHGWQLDDSSKQHEAIWLYGAGTGLSKEQIADVLSVSARTIGRYVADIDRRLREQRKARIQDLWLQCFTQDEIAEAL